MYEEENREPEFLKRFKNNPFQTPDNYFDTIEDKVMKAIQHEKKANKPSGRGKVIRLLKPVLTLAASLALVFMLAYYPFKYFSSEKMVQSDKADSVFNESIDFYSNAISLMDENSLVDALESEETTTQEEINPDEVLAYLSSDMNDIEIYTEIQN